MYKMLTTLLAVFGLGSVQASDFTANTDANKKTIKALIDAGSNPSKLHPLEHHFYCNNPESLKALMAKGESLGYGVANVGDNDYEGTHYWYGDLIKDTVLNLKSINKENSLMLKLANEFDADYDGWGTPVVK
jgi:hypothetical protein